MFLLQRRWCFFVRRCREGVVGFFDTFGATTAALLVLLFSLLLLMLLCCGVSRFACACLLCCFFVAIAALLLLLLRRCASPSLLETEGSTTSSPARTVLHCTALPWTALPRTTQKFAVFANTSTKKKTKKNVFSSLSGCLLRFSSLSLSLCLDTLELSESSCETLVVPPPKPLGLNKKTQRAPNVHFERPCGLQTKKQQERREKAKFASGRREQKSTKCLATTLDRSMRTSDGFSGAALLLLCCCLAAALLLPCCCLAAALLLPRLMTIPSRRCFSWCGFAWYSSTSASENHRTKNNAATTRHIPTHAKKNRLPYRKILSRLGTGLRTKS